MILVDSTKYISWMRAGQNPVTVLQVPLRAGLLVSCGIVRIEVLRGTAQVKPRAQMAALFESIPEIPLDTAVVADAAETAWALDRQGCVLPVADLLIAACAKRVGATVVTEDPHFSRIPGLKLTDQLPGGK